MAHGVFTDQPGTLSNEVFVNLLDLSTQWTPSTSAEGIVEGRDRTTGAQRWTATEVDLVFAAAWTRVMNLDRFDLPKSSP